MHRRGWRAGSLYSLIHCPGTATSVSSASRPPTASRTGSNGGSTERSGTPGTPARSRVSRVKPTWSGSPPTVTSPSWNRSSTTARRSRTPAPTTTAGEEPTTRVNGSRSESGYRCHCTGESWGPHASSTTPARYQESPARTDSSPQHLTPSSPNWSETTTTASHFTTHGGTYQRDDYRPVEPATGRGVPDNSIRSRCGSSRTDGVVRRVTASSPTPPNARTRKPPRPALNSTPSEPTPRRTDSCN